MPNSIMNSVNLIEYFALTNAHTKLHLEPIFSDPFFAISP